MKNYKTVLISFLSGIVFSILLLLLILPPRDYSEDKELYCDLYKSIIAEREYTYPIFRDLGYDPDDYGKDILNPITTKLKYFEGCNE